MGLVGSFANLMTFTRKNRESHVLLITKVLLEPLSVGGEGNELFGDIIFVGLSLSLSLSILVFFRKGF